MECDSVCGLWLTRAGNNDEKNAGRDDNVGVCHIIDQGGALRSALRVLISASIIPYLVQPLATSVIAIDMTNGRHPPPNLSMSSTYVHDSS